MNDNVTADVLHALLTAMQGKRVLIIGDIMLDGYLFGEATRISPEAPVPVVLVNEEKFVLGGAGNVARNVATMGGIPTLVGYVGADSAARRINGLLSEENIVNGLVELPTRRTTVKQRLLAQNQQMVRIDREDTSPCLQSELSAVMRQVEQVLPGHDAIVLSDYAKGLINREFMKGFWEIVHRQSKRPYVFIDPKPVNRELYKGAFLLTPNAKETKECVGMPTRTQSEVLAAGTKLVRDLGLPYLLTTLGADGMALFCGTDEVWHIPTFAQKVFDVTGAGDTVIATVALAMAAGGNLLTSCVLANAAAGVVVASVGAATAKVEEIKQELHSTSSLQITRWK